MSKRHPQNGPTFSKAPAKTKDRAPAPSPDRQAASLDERKRDAAKEREMHKDLGAWVLKRLSEEKD